MPIILESMTLDTRQSFRRQLELPASV
jgi:hypothetical protein